MYSLHLELAERYNWCKERLYYALRTAQYETRTLGGVTGLANQSLSLLAFASGAGYSMCAV